MNRRLVSTGLAQLTGLALLGCGGDKGETGGSASGDSGGGGDGGTTDSGSGGDSGASDGWRLGGTAGMAESYPEPDWEMGESCALSCSMTLGPCYSATEERQDISEGRPGQAMRLAFRVVDSACQPVEGAAVDIWHTSNDGFYSGEEAQEMCTQGNEEAIAASWFRGVQTTDTNGRADFNSCFPGWYSGRTIHIHTTIRWAGQEYLTSQLFFEQSLSDSICGEHPDYAPRGTPDTTNETDGVARVGDLSPYIFDVEWMEDGVLLAWKTIVIRASLSEAPCEAASP
jgi:protocatechuate 3,4-dioxygenase beta subunit